MLLFIYHDILWLMSFVSFKSLRIIYIMREYIFLFFSCYLLTFEWESLILSV